MPSFIRLLMGFISRQEAEDFLHKSENGTFLIRFSDSELGGVTVAWITVNETGTTVKLIFGERGCVDPLCISSDIITYCRSKRGCHVTAVHTKGSHDKVVARSFERLSSNDDFVSKQAKGSSLWKLLQPTK